MEFDDIGTTGKAQALTLKRQTLHYAEGLTARLARQIDPFMHQSAFRSEPILRPCLLQVNQCPLPRAEG
jgi:hypothetical protein